jgi:hypothetical protein
MHPQACPSAKGDKFMKPIAVEYKFAIELEAQADWLEYPDGTPKRRVHAAVIFQIASP